MPRLPGRREGAVTAHSPGPWSVGTWRSSDDFGWTVDLGGDQRIIVHAQSAESEANVDLIAAAPELLAALRECLKALSYFHGDEGWTLAETKILDATRAAIARATGGAK